MLILSLILILIAIIFLWQSRRLYKKTGLPGGKLIYIDTQQWGPVEKPLFSADLKLTGRPDYLINMNDQIIPVEVKSSRAKGGPYDSHIFQLGAYCLLVSRVYAIRPDYGILHYPNATYRIDFTQELESSVLRLLEEMRGKETRRVVHRSHEISVRCRGCGFRNACSESLV